MAADTEVIQGSDFRISCTFSDADGEPIDLTGGIGRIVVRDNISGSGPATIDVDSEDNEEIFDFTDATSGKIVVRVPGALLDDLVVQSKKRVHAQVEVTVDSTYRYRSTIIPIQVIQSLIL
jgi:hypothetical protein